MIDAREEGRRVVVVTGGGGGIGAAIAEELGRTGSFVVTMDPLVSLDGTERAQEPEETTADRIVAAGGAALATSVSVTDGDAVADTFADLVERHGGVDAVVNVAGITRPTSFTRGSDSDWSAVLAVHLDGYLNVLSAALPIMAAAGHGQILGITSGSGWRAADTGAYGCAKRAVAALTWQLGRRAPPGVVVNALSPIAATRMVTAALRRAEQRPGSGPATSTTGGLSLASIPAPDQLGPLGAHLVADEPSWFSGQVIYGGGSEVAVIDPPRLLEVVRSDRRDAFAHVLEAVVPGAFVPAEAAQSSLGGGNPRFGGLFDDPPTGDLPPPVVETCAVATDRPAMAATVLAALENRGVRCTTVPLGDVASGFAGPAGALASAAARVGPLDAVVVAPAGSPRPPTGASGGSWQRVLAEHAGLAGHIRADAGWARAVADCAARTARPLRLVTLTDATTSGGRSRAQAAAQLARAARPATEGRVSAFAVGLETDRARDEHPVGEFVAHLLCSPEAPALTGAELAAGPGWLGLRGHPRPGGSITFGGPDVPPWLDATLRAIVGVGEA